jgi:hypothetical protein
MLRACLARRPTPEESKFKAIADALSEAKMTGRKGLSLDQ